MVEQNRQTYNRNIIVLIFLVGGFVTILNQTVLITALPQIMKSFQIGADTAQWLTTVYMLTNGILIPITAFLIGKYTTRQLLIVAMSLFIFGTVLGAISNNFTSLIIARLIQASGAGIIMPLMQTVIFSIFPKEKRGAAMGVIGLVVGFAPAIGPTLSGFIVDNFSWRYIFFMVLPVAIIDLIFAIVAMKNVTEVNRNQKIDLPSVILSTVGFGFLLYGTSIAGSKGLSSAILWLVIGAIGVTFLIIRGLKLEKPMLEFRVFKSYIFTLTTIIVVISFINLMGVETMLPIYMQNLRGMNALYSGLSLLPGAIVMAIVSLIAGRIYDKIGGKQLGLIGFIIIIASTIPFIVLKIDTSISVLVVFYALRMIGLAMITMTLTTEGLNSLPANLIRHGTAMSNTVRQIGGSIGTALVITVYTNVANNAIKSGKIENNMIAQVHGMNYGFIVVAVFAIIGMLMTFRLKGKSKSEKDSKNDVFLDELKVSNE